MYCLLNTPDDRNSDTGESRQRRLFPEWAEVILDDPDEVFEWENVRRQDGVSFEMFDT